MRGWIGLFFALRLLDPCADDERDSGHEWLSFCA